MLPDHIDNAHDDFEAYGFCSGVHGDSVNEDEGKDKDLEKFNSFQINVKQVKQLHRGCHLTFKKSSLAKIGLFDTEMNWPLLKKNRGPFWKNLNKTYNISRNLKIILLY